MLISEWMGKQYVVYPEKWILFGHKKEWSTDTYYNADNLENIMLSEKCQTRKATCYMIPFR